jgi:MoxR-like ATPase
LALSTSPRPDSLLHGSPQPAPAAPSADEIARLAAPLRTLQEQVAKVVVGQDRMIRCLLIGLLTGGHVLLEGVPGLAKTLTVSTLAKGLDASFKRIQFTPDLLPADLVGTLIYSPRDGTFSARKGPVFANLVLADEINRAPAKVQSALLESMQERQVTIGDETYPLPDPFLVLATQNPIEQEGTYPLPEAQVDRFMLKVVVSYPTRQQERLILDRMASSRPTLDFGSVASVRDVAAARLLIDRIHIDARVRDYMVDLVHATRVPAEYKLDLGGHTSGSKDTGGSLIEFGASPRASIALAMAARAQAFLEGRAYVTPHDVKSIAMEVLRHRVIVSYEAEAREITSDQLVQRILDQLPVP